MSCRRFEKWIALAAGGDLGSRQTRRLEAHLAACELCRRFAEDMAEARAEFVAAAEVEPADYDAIRAGVMERIAADRPRRAVWWWGAGAAAAAALVIAMLWPRAAVLPPPAPAPRVLVTRAEPPKPAPPKVVAVRRVRRAPRPVEVVRPPQDDPERPAVVRIKTNDPRVVVYWVMEKTGDD